MYPQRQLQIQSQTKVFGAVGHLLNVPQTVEDSGAEAIVMQNSSSSRDGDNGDKLAQSK